MLAPGGEVDGDSLWARRSVESLGLYPGFVRELEAESGVAIDLRHCGALELAYSDYELREITRKAADQAKLGIASSAVNEKEARALAPDLATEGLAGARHYPSDAMVDPRDILTALERVLRGCGCDIRERETVRSLDNVNERAIVLAAGAWSGELLPGARATFPVKGHLIGYRLRPGSVPLIVRHGHTYILQRTSGFTIAGSTTERVGFDARTDPAIVARLHQRARRYLPGLLLASPDESWTGLRPGVEGGDPQVGRYGDTNIWQAYGHYRNGILLAPVTAKMIASDITNAG